VPEDVRLVRVGIVDDHPAVRAGLEAVLGDAAGIVPVGSATGELDLWPLLRRAAPDVLLLDHHLEGTDGLHLCRRIKADPPAPRVLIYTAYAGGELEVAARLARADGVVSKGVPPQTLAHAVRTAAGGELEPAQLTPAMLSRAVRCVAEGDRSALAMMLRDTPADDVCAVLDIDEAVLRARIDRMIAALSGCVAPH
jgi:DNA-binding NarL/FixJ family response regulator